eukprot:1200677-Karenia_brevis.AAC.1
MVVLHPLPPDKRLVRTAISGLQDACSCVEVDSATKGTCMQAEVAAQKPIPSACIELNAGHTSSSNKTHTIEPSPNTTWDMDALERITSGWLQVEQLAFSGVAAMELITPGLGVSDLPAASEVASKW